jgi:hypothetical protein
MTRLCDEIPLLRDRRASFVKDMKNSVAEMRKDFRQKFVSDLTDHVNGILESFREAREEMAEKTRTELETFVSELVATVKEIRAKAAEDIAGAHQAWGSLSQGDSPEPVQKEKGEPAAVAKKQRRSRAVSK